MTKPAYVDDEEHAPPSPAMTVPTQAQREAAARAMFELEYKLMGSDLVIPEWDESHRSYWGPLASAALAAAAGAGKQYTAIVLCDRELENKTIERCAQVADKYADRSSTAAAIAEDIRAMKDEP